MGLTPSGRRGPTVTAGLGTLVLAIGLLAAGCGDDGGRLDTGESTTSEAPPTTAPPTSSPATTELSAAEDLCGAGDQVACDELGDDLLQMLCDEGNVDACQVLLARQGDGVVDGTDD